MEQSKTVVISDTQRMVNKQFGIDDETFAKYAPRDENGNLDQNGQATVAVVLMNKITDKYLTPQDDSVIQRRVNEMLGVSQEAFKKYNSKGA